MKINGLLSIALFSLCTCLPALAADRSDVRYFPYKVSFELGDAEFAPGDNITIEEVRGTSEGITTGQTYCVSGTYTLASKEEAKISLFATATSGSGRSQIDPSQTMHVTKGSGSFRLIKTMNEPGYLHVSFYPAKSGSGFGGVYFGQSDGVLRNKHFSYLQGNTLSPAVSLDSGGGDASGAPSPMVEAAADANRILLDYLGEPVAQPANLAFAYTKEGILRAIQSAANQEGVTLKKLELEDSEFPCLLGVAVDQASDFEKVKANLKRTGLYDYPGSVGSDTCHAFTIVPYHAYPSDTAERIHHRLMLREQVFYDKIIRH
jgi:hypothetical protein